MPGLITTLVGNVTNPSSTEIMKESTLQAIGYVCQDVEHRWDLKLLVCTLFRLNIVTIRGWAMTVNNTFRKNIFWTLKLNVSSSSIHIPED